MKPFPLAVFALMLQIGKIQPPPEPMILTGSNQAEILANVASFDFVLGRALSPSGQLPIPRRGVLRGFYLATETTTCAGSTGSVLITVQVNGSNTAIAITIPALSAAGVYSDLAHTVVVAPGDLLSLSTANNCGSGIGPPILGDMSIVLQ